MAEHHFARGDSSHSHGSDRLFSSRSIYFWLPAKRRDFSSVSGARGGPRCGEKILRLRQAQHDHDEGARAC